MNKSFCALVVDNNPVFRRIITAILHQQGWETITAHNGLEALDLLNSKQPDIVFTDLIMPKINGEKLSYIIRNTPHFADIFLVILSGVAMEDDERTQQIGADVIIAKGPTRTMRSHILAALEKFHSGERRESGVAGIDKLYSREVIKELLLSKRHNEVVLANMNEGVFELTQEGRIVMVNSAGVALCEMEEAELLGKKFQDFFQDKEKQAIEQWLDSNDSFSGKMAFSSTYDNPAHIHDKAVTVNLLSLFEEENLFCIALVRDISVRKALEARQKRLEKEMQRIRKIDAMSVMAGGIAHDFNNLLTIITGNVEMARYVSHDEEVQSLLQEVTKALGLTTQLIRKFTTFSQNYLPQKSLVDLRELISKSLERQTRYTQVKFHIKSDSTFPHVYLDPFLLQQVFDNLALNAIEAMSGEGRISVALEVVTSEDEVERTNQPIPEGRHVHIRFNDTGKGIPKSIINKIFDPYYSTKQKGAQKGMGLGLSIAHAVMLKHGGMIWVESEENQGTCVHLYLPTAEPGSPVDTDNS